jgi:hypothetical protein
MPVSHLTQSQVVAKAVNQTMALVRAEVDTNHSRAIEEGELNELMKAIDAFQQGGGPPSQGALPDEKTRMRLGVMQALSTLSDDPALKDAKSVPLKTVRAALVKTYDKLITDAKKLDDDSGLMGGLGALLGLTMLPDVAVKHIQEVMLAKEGDA